MHCFFGFILITLSQCDSNAPKLPEDTGRGTDTNQGSDDAGQGSTPTVSKYHPEYHSVRLGNAFSSWGVRLSVEPSSSRRTMNGDYYSHSYWVGLTDETCNEAGYDDCRFQRIDPNENRLTVSAVGQCALQYYPSSGEILSATMLIHKGYQEHPAPSEEEKQIVYTHELGHCLGLRHTDEFLSEINEDYIMHPHAFERSVIPHPDELDAITFTYKDILVNLPSGVTPSGRPRSDFFDRNTAKDSFVRHRTLPVFYYYDPEYTGKRYFTHDRNPLNDPEFRLPDTGGHPDPSNENYALPLP